MKKKTLLILPIIFVIAFTFYWLNNLKVSYEVVNIENIGNPEIAKWIKEKKNQDGTYIFKTDEDIYVYFNASNSPDYSYPEFQLNHNLFKNDLKINVEKKFAVSEEHIQSEVIIQTSNKNYKKIDLKEYAK